MTKNKESGFVALFFVLIFASALGFLMLSLSLKSKNMLVLFGNMRNNNAARVAADYCLQKLLNNKTANIGYIPTVGVNLQISDGLICKYKSFVDTPEVSPPSVSTDNFGVVNQHISVQRGTTTYEANILRKFTVQILGTYTKSGATFRTTSHEIIKEFYITDSL